MFKKSKYFLIVDSVEKAIKFYAEKLLFTVTDVVVESGANRFINYAELRRGKCSIVLRVPELSELADFSMVRRVSSRACGMYLELKDGIEDFFENCKKKKVIVTSGIVRHPQGYAYFQALDPFGSKLYFYQVEDRPVTERESNSICGLVVGGEILAEVEKGGMPQVVSDHLKVLGLTRRVAKKYVKAWFNRYHPGRKKRASKK